MSKKKRDRAAAAAAGTKSDPNRAAGDEGAGVAHSMVDADGAGKVVHGAWAPHMDSKREQHTSKFFLVVEVILVLVPVALIATFVMAKGSLSAENLQAYFSEDPVFAVSFLAACVQPFAAYLLRIVYKKYTEGDMGYAAGNLAVLLCAEMALQNLVGMAGMALLLWRVWKNAASHMGDWFHERGVGGVLFDISGALVVTVFALICAFANMRLSA